MFVNPETAKKLFFQELVQGFDQETAAVVVARLTSYKMETEVIFLDYYLVLHKLLLYSKGNDMHVNAYLVSSFCFVGLFNSSR